jgi:nifR3 family TIM-barrel protein
LTVKFRKGFNEENINAVEFAKMAESCGVAAIAVHGRTREQYYSGKADWDMIRQVKEAVSIPVIGNGGIFCGADALRMLEETGCDGIMVGRGAEGNPFIFEEIRAALEGREYTPPSAEMRISAALLHAEMLCKYKGEYIGIHESRKHVAWYLKGIRDSAKMRAKCNYIESLGDLISLIEEYKNNLDNEIDE